MNPEGRWWGEHSFEFRYVIRSSESLGSRAIEATQFLIRFQDGQNHYFILTKNNGISCMWKADVVFSFSVRLAAAQDIDVDLEGLPGHVLPQNEETLMI